MTCLLSLNIMASPLAPCPASFAVAIKSGPRASNLCVYESATQSISRRQFGNEHCTNSSREKALQGKWARRQLSCTCSSERGHLQVGIVSKESIGINCTSESWTQQTCTSELENKTAQRFEGERHVFGRGAFACGLGAAAVICLASVDGAAAGNASDAASSYAAESSALLSLLDVAIAVEPSNALSLPTWTIHIASVFEWVTAMALVWQYGETPGNSAWKGLAWGMVPLLGGAMAACTWHFFYNDPSLEVLVALQGALTFTGNCTLWIAAYRIYRLSQQGKA